MIKGKGLIIWDQIELVEAASLQWRLHSHLQAEQLGNEIILSSPQLNDNYRCLLESHHELNASLEFGYQEKIPVSGGVQSDSTTDIYHVEWGIPVANKHNVVMSCLKAPLDIVFDNESSLSIALNEQYLLVDEVKAHITEA